MRLSALADTFEQLAATSARGRRVELVLRFPRLVGGVRTDKGPADATTEREVVDMYHQQRGHATRHASGNR